MKVVFIYPSLADSGFSASGDPLPMRYIHHGLSYLSSSVRLAGFETGLIDLRALSGWDEFSGRIKAEEAAVFGITMMSPDYSYAMKCAGIIRKIRPDAKIVVGGIHPTIMPDELAADERIDYVVKGEGEIALVKLLNKIKENRVGDKVTMGEHCDVNKLPLIDRYLFDCLEYPFDSFMPLPFFTVMAGRGCSYNCRFCAPASKLVHGKGARRRDVDSVIEELKTLKDRYGMKSFMFHDDCFTEDRKWVLEFAAKYRAGRFRQSFVCQSRADIICRNPDMIRLLAKIGLKMMMIGFESGNDRVLKFIGKAVTLKQNLEAARICRQSNIRVWALHMYGLPTETNAEALDTVKMIRKIRPYRSSAAFFTPHPGSYLYDYCKANGLSLIDDHDDFVKVPEEDKPKIKKIDYDFMRAAAMKSKKLPLESRMTIRLDRIFRCRRNRRFLRLFRTLAASNPNMHKLDILTKIKAEYPDA